MPICSRKVDYCDEESCPKCGSGEIKQIVHPSSEHKPTENTCLKCGHRW